MTDKRYTVFPADADGHSNYDVVIAATDDLAEAKRIAASAPYPFGAVIEDGETGLSDQGFGFEPA